MNRPELGLNPTALPADSIVPSGSSDPIVSGLPLGGDHPIHPFIIDSEGKTYVDVASASNSCPLKNGTLKSRGVDPCTELETRGGVWLHDANKTNQVFSTDDRFATGIRNAEGFAIDSNGRLFVSRHGRDQPRANWPDLYKPDQDLRGRVIGISFPTTHTTSAVLEISGFTPRVASAAPA